VDTETDAASETPSPNAHAALGGMISLTYDISSCSIPAEDIVAWWHSGLPMNSVRPSSW